VDSQLSDDWWRRAVVYQIYPRSFQDSNGDGIGDLQGVIKRLDYLNDGTENSLGVDAIWFSPTFPSPMKDFGYDVSDYTSVHPDFGTLEDMDRLIAECHARGMRVLLDYVPNHTSDRHPWFLESAGSRDNARRDWYFWRDPKPGGALPNNWMSQFGGAGWTFDERTNQYYLHSFLREQPDLNWRNPEVVEAMHDVLRFWLDRGVDGFRIDVINMVMKHPELADNPPNPDWRPGMPDGARFLQVNNRNYPDVFDAVRGLRGVTNEYEGRMLVGEVYGRAEEVAGYYGGAGLDGLHLAFNFNLIVTENWRHAPWSANYIAGVIEHAEATLAAGAQPCYALGNHDQSRFVSRHDADAQGWRRARMAILFLLALRATPFLYYGEEIGMVDAAIPEAKLKDPARLGRGRSRDPQRTPMQWDASPGRGFTSGEPWLPFGPEEINVANQQSGDSLLSLYRRALWLRKRLPALYAGTFHERPSSEHVYSFERQSSDGSPVLFAMNTSDSEQRIFTPEVYQEMLISSQGEIESFDQLVVGDGPGAHCELSLPALSAIWLGRPES
jgi:alpha-glucosidase